MLIRCYNKKCGHEREYKGKFKDDNSLITCTKCRYKLRLGKAKVSEVTSQKTRGTSQKKRGTSQKKSEVGVPHEVPHVKYKKKVVQPKTESIVKDHYTPKQQIKALSPSLPSKVQEAFDKQEREQNNPLSNLPIEEPNFEMRVVGFDPLKTLNNQRDFF